MVDFRAFLETAIEHHRRGDLEQAEALYGRALEASPGHLETLQLHGTVLLQLKRFAECIAVLEQVAAGRPDVADAANNLGIAYQVVGRWDDAVCSFESAIRARPDYSEALFNLGALWETRGQADLAEESYRRALEFHADDSATRFRLGNLLKGQQRFREAEESYREVLACDPRNLDAHVNLGVVLVLQEKLPAAAAVFTNILELRPDYCEVLANLSFVFERQGQVNEAIAAAHRAIEIRPDYTEGWNNLGVALRSAHRLDEACDAFRQAEKLSPEFALAEFNHATTLLLAGKYRAGWPGYARHAETLGAGVREFSAPRWNGERLPGKTLLVYADQGFGDTIQFARFVPQVRQRSGARVIFECQPQLKALFEDRHGAAKWHGADAVLTAGEPLPEIDAVAPLACLPAMLEVELAALPADVPYLQTTKKLRHELDTLLSHAAPGSPRVGLVWQGNPRQARDVVRSCPLQKLATLFAIPQITFVSLQTEEPGSRQLSELFPRGLPSNLLDGGSLLESFSDTAALMLQLDLILTVDTATAHLAGALGRSTFIMLCHTPDWRWHLDRTDCPWYPTVRLFRQPRWGDWDAVVEEVARELRTFQPGSAPSAIPSPHSPLRNNTARK